MTKYLPIIFLLFNFSINAQESFSFEAQISPNKKYITQLESSSISEIDFIADEKTMEELKSQGVKLPLKFTTQTKMTTTISTGSKGVDGYIPATMEYGKVLATTEMNGETKTEEKPFSGAKILGKYDNNFKFEVDTIIGDNIDTQMRAVLKNILSTVQQSINFPKEPMQIGDTFQNKIPMSIPIQGMNPIKVIIKIDYLLRDIADGKATFDVNQQVSLDASQEQVNVKATGSGSGVSVYSVTDNYLIKNQSELPMELTAKINEKITSKVKATTQTNLSVIIQ
ncbi:hypothetical protein [Allomuricauda sp. SCSIO 65647]|uniref:hypothetical protein n=1 Tax=Allomuricauda sp. SCSIO 65647 TaxID=2908843 RepID=UPI001F474857|nr:hypothetical protein [Muricauda sp. SCSIO 65647]UJH68619.1 hypothetical protein L0P89_05245 [Muricauda sp. SCSIO 65647]